MDKLRVADAITEVFALFKRCNKYIDETMPWALGKGRRQRRTDLQQCFTTLIESITYRCKPFKAIYA